jgi:hypothetical protein
VEFVHEYQNYANDIVTEEEEVVARVRYTEQALSSPPKHTELQRAPDTSNVVALEIRGNPVDHAFQSENMEKGYASK